MKSVCIWWLAAASLLFAPAAVFAQENETLEKAVAWMVEQQDESGAFKSKHYGAMKQGAAITSLVLYSFSSLPPKLRSKQAEKLDDAFEFLMPGTKKCGQVANPDGSLDHPVYSTAMFLVAAKRMDKKLDRELVRTLLKFLVESQCAEQRGFEPNNPNYGGWDVLGPAVMPGKTSGTNVSVTRFVLEAFESWVPYSGDVDHGILNNATIDLVNESRIKARDWIKRLHVASGIKGFVFTAQPGSALNKSKTQEGRAQPYSSATSDGLGVYLLVSREGPSKVFRASMNWLYENVKSAKVAGFGSSESGGWAEALLFYHLQSLARVDVSFTPKKIQDWFSETRKEIDSTLSIRQKPDGSFSNNSSLMRENDPLIATSFAIIALSALEP